MDNQLKSRIETLVEEFGDVATIVKYKELTRGQLLICYEKGLTTAISPSVAVLFPALSEYFRGDVSRDREAACKFGFGIGFIVNALVLNPQEFLMHRTDYRILINALLESDSSYKEFIRKKMEEWSRHAEALGYKRNI